MGSALGRTRGGGILLWLCALAVLGAGTATLAGFAARWNWALELCCHFRVQYFWLLGGAAVALAWGRWRVWSLAAFMLAAFNLLVIVPLYFGPAPVGSGPTARAMSANVYWLNHEYERVIELVKREQPDFVLFLEVTPEWREALEALSAEYPYATKADRMGTSGMELISRRPLANVEVKNIGGAPAIVAEVEIDGQTLTLIGAHPASPGTAMHFDVRNQQYASLARIARRQQGPVMLLGDLNSTSWSPFFQQLLSDAGLRDSRRGFGVEGSWPGLPLPLRIPIDHCLTSPEISIWNRQVGPKIGSDHRPIVIDFSLQSP